jgi:5-methyltetrahydropteroyltriglutamate--homocysteine methyltransferase
VRSRADRKEHGNDIVHKIRADHVGSLLRPKTLLDARAAHSRGEIGDEALTVAEDEAILGALELQRSAGIGIYSDGEFRRASWVAGLYDAGEGLEPFDDPGYEALKTRWKGPGQDEANSELPIPSLGVARRLKLKRRITGQETPFLGRHAPGPFKATMPSPSIYARLYRPGMSEGAYGTMQAFIDDLVRIYQDEVEAQIADGAAYVQLDSLRYAQLFARESMGQLLFDQDPDEVLEQTIAADSAVLTHAKSKGAVTAIHICRGNHRSAWVGTGGYEPVAERVFAEVETDRFLLEFDDERSGGFEPLRFLPKGKTAVLGLVTTKRPELEDRDALRRRIDEAASYADIDDLALSPQCGFASTYLGNLLTEDDEKRKLELVVETAHSVWG